MYVVWSIDDFDEFLKSQMNDPEFNHMSQINKELSD